MNPALIALLALTLRSGRGAPVVHAMPIVPVTPPAAIEGRLVAAIEGRDAPVEYSDRY